MKLSGIRAQLVAWYSIFLALSLAAFGFVAYLAMSYGIRQTVRSELRQRAEGVRDIIIEDGPEGRVALEDEVKEFADGLGSGGRVRVADVSGVIFASSGMELVKQPANRVRTDRPWRQAIGGDPFLLARQTMNVSGVDYDVTIAVATGDLDRALERGSLLLLFSAPVFLALAVYGGYWMSRRALEPVARMAQTARSIGEQNLAKRLDVPSSRDELAQLAETLNEMLARLETAFQRITRFTADASHELRTPVAVMRTSAELALRKTRDPAEYRETLSQILREADKVSELIEELLDLARADSGSSQLKMERADLSAIMRAACEETRLLADEKGVSLTLVPGAPVWVMAEPASVQRLLLILLDNAVKYTPAGRHVSAGVSTRNGCAVAEVRDDGIGISGEDMPHIFDRFFRADRARSRELGGAGLGLAIGRWIAEAHGGEIRARSELGKGSAFEVTLPSFRGSTD
jgi:two-component system, OmpR family, heavy metal sensor histidine kinase CusS